MPVASKMRGRWALFQSLTRSQVYFSHDTVLDFNRQAAWACFHGCWKVLQLQIQGLVKPSASFFTSKLSMRYCVAPIKSKQCLSACGTDFWAVGPLRLQILGRC